MYQVRVRSIAGGTLAALSMIWLLGIAGNDDLAMIEGNPEPTGAILLKVAAGILGFVIGAAILKGGRNG